MNNLSEAKIIMTAVVVIDVQSDFVNRDVLGSPEAEAIIPEVCKLIKNRACGDACLFLTQDTHYADDYLDTQEGKLLPVEHCVAGTEGWKINYDVWEAAKSVSHQYAAVSTVEKPTFGSLALMYDLADVDEQEGLEEIVMVGLCTDICLINNIALAKAFFPETKVTVVERCCAGVTPEKHKAAIEVMKSLQVNVI